MAKPTLPGPIDKRNILYAPDPKRPADPLAIGDEFFGIGRYSEALDFYERVTDPARRDEALARARKQAIGSGNAFILGRIAQKGLVTVSKDDWKAAAQAAKAAGSLRYSLRAAIQAGDEELATELRTKLGDAVPAALAAKTTEATAAIAESPEQAKAGATTPGQKVEAVAAAGAAHAHAHEPAPAAPPASEPSNGDKPASA